MRAVPVGDEEIPHHGDTFFYDAFSVNYHPTKTVELGGQPFEASDSGLGFDVVRLGDEAKVEKEEE